LQYRLFNYIVVLTPFLAILCFSMWQYRHERIHDWKTDFVIVQIMLATAALLAIFEIVLHLDKISERAVLHFNKISATVVLLLDKIHAKLKTLSRPQLAQSSNIALAFAVGFMACLVVVSLWNVFRGDRVKDDKLAHGGRDLPAIHSITQHGEAKTKRA
jgi:capsular polysaccharide biosynthesis protein